MIMQIIGIPSALGSLVGKGCSKAPSAIIEKLNFIHSQHNTLLPQYKKLEINPANLEETFDLIEKTKKNSPKGTIFLGGDHSVTYPIIKAFANPDTAFVIFDAHPDCVQYFNPPSQEDFINVLISDEIISSNQIFLVGNRNIYPDEKKFIQEKKIRDYNMDKIFDLGIQPVMDALTEQLMKFKTIYVSLDIDCVDPVFAPGVDYPEPGGFNSRELIYIINRLTKLKQFSYLDIVEVNPEKDNGQTV